MIGLSIKFLPSALSMILAMSFSSDYILYLENNTHSISIAGMVGSLYMTKMSKSYIHSMPDPGSTVIQSDTLPDIELSRPKIASKDGNKAIAGIVCGGEEMPRFPGCENESGDTKAKEECSNRNLIDYVYKHLRYPAEARKKGVQGTVVISFVVNTNGTLEGFKIIRDKGAGLGQEAMRIMKSMNEEGLRWIPGMQRSRKVNVTYNVPVKFKLDI